MADSEDDKKFLGIKKETLKNIGKVGVALVAVGLLGLIFI